MSCFSVCKLLKVDTWIGGGGGFLLFGQAISSKGNENLKFLGSLPVPCDSVASSQVPKT